MRSSKSLVSDAQKVTNTAALALGGFEPACSGRCQITRPLSDLPPIGTTGHQHYWPCHQHDSSSMGVSASVPTDLFEVMSQGEACRGVALLFENRLNVKHLRAAATIK
jgi:hypothetical protein